MNFRSVSDLRDVIANNLNLIPDDIDLVVGIPRSGMLPAMLIALALNIQVTDLHGLKEGRVFQSGRTRRRGALDTPFDELKHALIVDDSVNSGGSMTEARELLSVGNIKQKMTFCAVYGIEGKEDVADIIMENVASPRVFEWNVLHHGMLAYACVDIDGVLCKDPTATQNDDGDEYRSFLRTAARLHIPTKKIHTLVTNRLEKYRRETEEWLQANGITYDNLVMLNLPDAETRRRTNANSTFKGNFYKNSKAGIFIESELWQAELIASISGKPVLCMEGPVMCYPAVLNPRGMYRRVRQSEQFRKRLKAIVGHRLYNRIVSAAK